MIVLASVQHTGTWSAISLLEQVMETKVTLLKDALIGEEVNGLLHLHIGGREGIHYRDKLKHASKWLATPVIMYHTTVVPVRDPMAAVITRQNRHPKMDHSYIVQGFEYLADLYEMGAVDMWLCQDLIMPAQQPQITEALFDLATKEGKALEWGVKNQSPDTSGLKKAYREGEYAEVHKALAIYWDQLHKSDRIKSFLNALGYDSLPWM